MAIEISGVIVGSCIGLIGGLGGVFVGHILTGRRESKNRKIAGLQEIQRELEKRNRLALDIVQHVNTTGKDGKQLFGSPGWKEATLALQERTWKIACVTYLPTAIEDFQSLDRQISRLMDDQYDQTDVVNELHAHMDVIETKLAQRMENLI